MGFFENILVALSGLRSNKMRAFLTMLGIIIGIGSVIGISTLGNIIETSVMDIFNQQGGASLVGFAISFKKDAPREYIYYDDFMDIDLIKDVENKFSEYIDAMIIGGHSSNAKMRIRRKEYDMAVYGVNSGYIKQSMTDMVAGRYITDADCDQLRSTCVISDRQATKLFGSMRGAIGKRISVTMMDGTICDFTVVGVYHYKISALMSSMMGAVGADADSWNNEIYIPYTTHNRLEGRNDDSFYSFNVCLKDNVDSKGFCEAVKSYVNNKYYRRNDSIELMYQTMESMMEMTDEVMGMLRLAISVIAGISLLVGGIGVMNIMLVSVTERTREIGVRKAMGAPNSAIRTQFIVESMIICLIGGIIGILFGIGLGNLAGIIVGTTAPPKMSSIVLAVGFSMAIGVFFGYYPANRAAKLDPIEALRYE